MATVVVDPVTRIEGHLRIEAETDADGVITRASSSGTMMRGIEIILRGRDPERRDHQSVGQPDHHGGPVGELQGCRQRPGRQYAARL